MSSSSEAESDWSACSVTGQGPDLSDILTVKETTNESLNLHHEEVMSQIDRDREYAMYLQNVEVEFPRLPERTIPIPPRLVNLDHLSVSSDDDSMHNPVPLPAMVDLNVSDESIDEDILELLDLTMQQRRQLLELMRTDSVNYSIPGLKQNQISRLQRPCVVNGDSDDNCGVCMAEFLTGEKKRTLKCQHFFHVDCIDQWLQKTALCPLCRNQVIPPKRIRLPKCVIL